MLLVPTYRAQHSKTCTCAVVEHKSVRVNSAATHAWCCREETGACYAIDIGGTNFRVVYYKLSDKRGVVVSSSIADQHSGSTNQCRVTSSSCKSESSSGEQQIPETNKQCTRANCNARFSLHDLQLRLCNAFWTAMHRNGTFCVF